MAGCWIGIALIISTGLVALPAHAQETSGAEPLPSPASTPASPSPAPLTPEASPALETKQASTQDAALPAQPVKPRKRKLLDLNKDGRITIKDALRLAGLRGQMDQVAGLNSEGRLALRNPKKLVAEALLDLAEDGKIAPMNPVNMVGLQIANFNGVAKVGYRNKRLTVYRTWQF